MDALITIVNFVDCEFLCIGEMECEPSIFVN